MRFLLTSNFYPPNFVGGAELVAHRQARSLQELGHEVVVFAGEAWERGEHYSLQQDEWQGVPVFRIAVRPEHYRLDRVNFAHAAVEARFEEVLESFRPDVFHTHNLIGLSVALPRIAQRRGIATVVTLHDHWGFCLKNTLLKSGDRVCTDTSRCAECLPVVESDTGSPFPHRMRADFLARMLAHVDLFVSPSRYLADAYVAAGFPRERVQVLANGVEAERFGRVTRRPADGSLRLSFIGGFFHHKGAPVLVEALHHLPSDAPVRLNLVGDGDQRRLCEQIVTRNGWADRVRFWGRVGNDRIDEVYACTDVLVLPSIWPENQPVTVTEAMACGLPVIVSDLGGTRELVEDGVTGLVFRAGDPGDLARCIRALLEDEDARSRYGRAARERIAPRTFAAQAERFLELLQSRPGTAAGQESRDRVVICSGRQLDPAAGRVMDAFPASEGWRFIARDWADDELVRSAWLHWVLDRSMSTGHALAERQPGVPMLVPGGNLRLGRALVESGGALHYSSVDDAVAAIRLLADDPAVRAHVAAGDWRR